jgi:hypothetical protein
MLETLDPVAIRNHRLMVPGFVSAEMLANGVRRPRDERGRGRSRLDAEACVRFMVSRILEAG